MYLLPIWVLAKEKCLGLQTRMRKPLVSVQYFYFSFNSSGQKHNSLHTRSSGCCCQMLFSHSCTTFQTVWGWAFWVFSFWTFVWNFHVYWPLSLQVKRIFEVYIRFIIYALFFSYNHFSNIFTSCLQIQNMFTPIIYFLP